MKKTTVGQNVSSKFAYNTVSDLGVNHLNMIKWIITLTYLVMDGNTILAPDFKETAKDSFQCYLYCS